MKTVVSADTFGDQSEGNVAEFLKFLPSIGVGYVDQDARTVSVRGMPAGRRSSPRTAWKCERGRHGDARVRIREGDDQRPRADRVQQDAAARHAAEGIGGTINMVTKARSTFAPADELSRLSQFTRSAPN